MKEVLGGGGAMWFPTPFLPFKAPTPHPRDGPCWCSQEEGWARVLGPLPGAQQKLGSLRKSVGLGQTEQANQGECSLSPKKSYPRGNREMEDGTFLPRFSGEMTKGPLFLRPLSTFWSQRTGPGRQGLGHISAVSTDKPPRSS